MSTTPNPLGNIGSALITAITGTDPATLAAQATAAEQALQIAITTQIALTAIMVAELFLITVLLWKGRH